MADGVRANLKLTGISLLAIVVLITILQNNDPVNIEFLWMDVTVPLAMLLLATVVVGFGMGALFFYRRARKAKHAAEATEESA